jgi:tetratricopeptide (TPR) repeat protein
MSTLKYSKTHNVLSIDMAYSYREASGQGRLNRMLRPTVAPKATAQLQRVPIDEIFNVEFQAYRTSSDILKRSQLKGPEWIVSKDQTELRKTYERYVSGLMDYVSDRLLGRPASHADPEALARAVNRTDEYALFAGLVNTFYWDLGADTTGGNVRLLSAIETNRFNCYASTVLFTDVLTRLGKSVDIILTPFHVFPAGEECYVETASKEGFPAHFRRDLSANYPRFREEASSDALLGLVYDCASRHLSCEDRYAEALEMARKALEIAPRLTGPWVDMGNALDGLGRHNEARRYRQHLYALADELRVAQGLKPLFSPMERS